MTEPLCDTRQRQGRFSGGAQVQYSLLDRRPENGMAAFCAERGIRLLPYGTTAGGLLSDKYLGLPAGRCGGERARRVSEELLPNPAWRGVCMCTICMRAADGTAIYSFCMQTSTAEASASLISEAQDQPSTALSSDLWRVPISKEGKGSARLRASMMRSRKCCGARAGSGWTRPR